MTEPGSDDKNHHPLEPADPTRAFQAPAATPGFQPADVPMAEAPDPFAAAPDAVEPAPETGNADTVPAGPDAASTSDDSAAGAAFGPPPSIAFLPPPPPPQYGSPGFPYGVQPKEPYPIRLEIEYREPLSRLSTFFRLFLLLPGFLFVTFVSPLLLIAVCTARVTAFMRRKYPDWLFAAIAGSFAWTQRFYAYTFLLTDHFPSFGQESSGAVVLEIDEPIQGGVSRWRGFIWRSLLLVPQFVVLQFLHYAVYAVTVLAGVAILFTGRYPRGLFGFMVGVQRWYARVYGYQLLLTDRYPPYALSAEAGPASNKAVVWSGVIGAAGAAVYGIIIIAVVVAASKNDIAERQVDYAKLSQGSGALSLTFNDYGGPVTVRLVRAYDPGNDQIRAIVAASSERVVVFEWEVRNNSSDAKDIGRGVASLATNEDGNTKDHSPDFVVVEDRSAPASIRDHGVATVRAVFVIPTGAKPVTLDFNGGRAGNRAIGEIRYRFAQ